MNVKLPTTKGIFENLEYPKTPHHVSVSVQRRNDAAQHHPSADMAQAHNGMSSRILQSQEQTVVFGEKTTQYPRKHGVMGPHRFSIGMMLPVSFQLRHGPIRACQLGYVNP